MRMDLLSIFFLEGIPYPIINYKFFSVGTAGIILQAPSLYDLRPAIDEYLSEIEVAVAKPHGGEI